MVQQLINDERFTNIQRAQAGLTKLFEEAQADGTFYRVMKNDEPLGVLIPNNMWQSLTEDLEALSSPNYKASIAKARKEKKFYTSEQVKEMLEL